ncbi:MAG: multifunctional CCA addition/repair protein [Gammaproteobacteria bacterium]|nr:multifunctional CCA addition/repair protein [Gammaproteobacteria bacterium]MDH3768357.1 multifunctional CCA addition/repair protein [Gammaproteobacteria bacterium]
MKIYRVGGAVRDRLLGEPAGDDDWVVVGAMPQEMLDRGFRQVGADFPVFLHPETNEEYALARTERKTGRGYHGFVLHAAPDVTLEQDLARRDLTINAIAEDENGQPIDPHGGADDISARKLRHVSEAFVEDPVRVLRTARFAARFKHLGFEVATETMALMTQMTKDGEVDALVPERVWQETLKALSTAHPATFFQVLRDCGALAVIYPELDALFGVPQPARWHPEIDTGRHVLMVLEQAAQLSANTRVRFAALTHDLGKGSTPKAEWPSHRGHEQRSIDLLNKLCDRLRVPNEHRELAQIVALDHGRCHRAMEMRANTVIRLLEQCDAFRRPERFELFLLACEADARGRLGMENRGYPQAELLRKALATASRISANDIDTEGLQGEAIGTRLHQARVAAIRKSPD